MIHSSLLSPKIKTVTVEYTANGQRVKKSFTNVSESRRFYTAKMKAGAEPKIVSAALS